MTEKPLCFNEVKGCAIVEKFLECKGKQKWYQIKTLLQKDEMKIYKSYLHINIMTIYLFSHVIFR